MKDMLVMVPSRGRPEKFARLYESWKAVDTQIADMLVILDDDDVTLEAYPRYEDISYLIGPRQGFAQSMNTVSAWLVDDYRVIGQQGDDHLVRTPKWDEKILEAIGDVGVAYGNDLWQGPNMPTASYMTSNIIKALGQFCPKTLWHLYVDNYWRDLGNGAGCLHYLEDVIIEHMHPDAGKADFDTTYDEGISTTVYSSDGAKWAEYMIDNLPSDIQKVKELMASA